MPWQHSEASWSLTITTVPWLPLLSWSLRCVAIRWAAQKKAIWRSGKRSTRISCRTRCSSSWRAVQSFNLRMIPNSILVVQKQKYWQSCRQLCYLHLSLTFTAATPTCYHRIYQQQVHSWTCRIWMALITATNNAKNFLILPGTIKNLKMPLQVML